jgi:hypothetical protein
LVVGRELALASSIANEVLGVVAERAVGLGAQGVERVAGPGLESLLVEANLAYYSRISIDVFPVKSGESEKNSNFLLCLRARHRYN